MSTKRLSAVGLFICLISAARFAFADQIVYTMTNSALVNEIVRLEFSNGTFSSPVRVETGGKGSAGPLENQNGLVLGSGKSASHLFAVNAGSNDMSVFRVAQSGLVLVDRVATGGTRPVSIAVRDDLVYVLNSGSSSNVSGFRFQAGGTLEPIAGSIVSLPARDDEPAQAQFVGGRRHLVVTERTKNRLDVIKLDRTGRAVSARSFRSSGPGPFGFAVKRRSVYVSELSPSALSVYNLTNSGRLVLRESSIEIPGQFAACWAVLARLRDGSFQIYVSNTGSDTISRFSEHGSDVRLSQAVAARTRGSAPTDLFVSSDDSTLFALNAADGNIDAFTVNRRSGSLSYSSTSASFPVFANGLVSHEQL